MHCPFCQATDTRVIDSRLKGEGFQIRRRRECSQCGARFNTFETPEMKLPNVVKSGGNREAFDPDKLRSGMFRALEKRPVDTDEVEEAIARILHALRSVDAAEIPARAIGEHVMAELKRLDQVAYVRFASVYKRFEDPDAFLEVIEQLRTEAPEGLDSRQLSLLGNRLAGLGDGEES
ncbi:MAG: transcriptional regulator NrdR [Xanthomonadales bacterium]|nr:transcriptional regulator NrdR [Xanthomonadales bacterium]